VVRQIEAKEIGTELIKLHGLDKLGWKIEFNKSPKFLAQCWHHSKVIAVSVYVLNTTTESVFRNTMLHEIAHALVGPGNGHNEIWKAKALEIGNDGEICGVFHPHMALQVTPAEQKAKAHVPPLKAKCPYCGKVIDESARLKVGDKTFIKSNNCTHIIAKDNVKEVSYDNWVSATGKVPYPYQVEGFKFIERANGRCLIADEPALGKTVQALSFLNFHTDIACPALWLGKTTLKIQTLKENIDWCGFEKLPTQIVEHSRFFPLPGMKVYISSYDLLKRIKKEKIEAMGIKTVIFDEVQHIKNPDSARTQEVRNVVNSADFFIALSGTPWKNRGSEYFSVLNMLAPEKFPSFKQFINRWVRMDYDNQTGKYKEGGIRDIPAFREYTKDIVLRRLRKDVLPDLPPINRQIRYVELEDIYGENYEKAEVKVAAIIKDLILDGKSTSTQQMQAEIMKLKHITGLAKVDAQVEDAISFLEDSEDWEKLTIFHHHIDVGDDLQFKMDKYLQENGYSKSLRLKGGMNSFDRDDIIQKFKRDCKSRILIASTLASGEGLNIQFCQNASMMERQWNPANEEQAELRFSRPLTWNDYPPYLQEQLFDENHEANKVSIRVPYLICANTVDEMLTHLVERKRVNFRQSMNVGDEELKFSEADMVRELAEAIVRKRYGKAA